MYEYLTIYPTPWTLLETEQLKIRFITNENYRKSVEKFVYSTTFHQRPLPNFGLLDTGILLVLVSDSVEAVVAQAICAMGNGCLLPTIWRSHLLGCGDTSQYPVAQSN